MKEVFNEYIARNEFSNLYNRVHFQSLDFLKNDFPSGDIDAFLFGNVIHDWNDEVKQMLMGKAFKALKSGGRIIIHEFFLDEEKKEKTFSFTLSLHMQLVTADGNQNTPSEMAKMLEKAGFVNA
jgi:SAM-dependent methyltransferase